VFDAAGPSAIFLANQVVIVVALSCIVVGGIARHRLEGEVAFVGRWAVVWGVFEFATAWGYDDGSCKSRVQIAFCAAVATKYAPPWVPAVAAGVVPVVAATHFLVGMMRNMSTNLVVHVLPSAPVHVHDVAAAWGGPLAAFIVVVIVVAIVVASSHIGVWAIARHHGYGSACEWVGVAIVAFMIASDARVLYHGDAITLVAIVVASSCIGVGAAIARHGSACEFAFAAIVAFMIACFIAGGHFHLPEPPILEPPIPEPVSSGYVSPWGSYFNSDDA
jgi:hypothetical protein